MRWNWGIEICSESGSFAVVVDSCACRRFVSPVIVLCFGLHVYPCFPPTVQNIWDQAHLQAEEFTALMNSKINILCFKSYGDHLHVRVMGATLSEEALEGEWIIIH